MSFDQHGDFDEVTLAEAAELLGVPRIFVRNLIEDDTLPNRIDNSNFRRIRRIPLLAVQVYRERMRDEQRSEDALKVGA